MSSDTFSGRLRAVLLAALTLVFLGGGVSQAGDADDHERARRALESGEILPLRTILERVERDHPGQIMEVELDREDGRWLYEVKVLRAGGALVKIEIDARDGTLLRLKGPKDRNGRAGTPR